MTDFEIVDKCTKMTLLAKNNLFNFNKVEIDGQHISFTVSDSQSYMKITNIYNNIIEVECHNLDLDFVNKFIELHNKQYNTEFVLLNYTIEKMINITLPLDSPRLNKLLHRISKSNSGMRCHLYGKPKIEILVNSKYINEIIEYLKN